MLRLLCLVSTAIGCCLTQLVVNMTMPNDECYADLYTTALRHYNLKNYEATHAYLELALADKRYRDVMLLKCSKRCTKSDASSQGMFFANLSKKQQCIQKCMKKLFGAPVDLNLWVIKDFRERNTYSFLQYAYFKKGNLQAAYEAAVTNLKYNKDNEMMQKNVKYYGSKISQVGSIPREPDDSADVFLIGLSSYGKDQYKDATVSFNTSLNLYVDEIEECKTRCEIGYDRYVDRKIPNLDDVATFYEQFVKLYHRVLECRYKCVESYNSRITAREGYLPSLLNYIQFSAYQAGHLKFAAQLASLYLYIMPGDQAMINNLNFYIKALGEKPAHIPALKALVDQNILDLEVLTAVVGKKDMRARLKNKQDIVMGDLGLVSDLKPDRNVLWTNTY